MTTTQFLADLARRGVVLWAEGERLRYRAPQGVLSPALREELAERKPELLALLRERDAAPARRLPQLAPDPARRHEPFPLTDIQQAYWVGRGAGLELGNVATHVYLELERDGLDLAGFNRAWQRLIDRHDMLRAIVRADGLQQILAQVPRYEIAVTDLRGETPERAAAHLADVREQLSHQVLPAARWPLFDIRATRLDQARVRLHVSIDMLIVDAWSLRLLVQELLRLDAEPATELPPLELSFRDYVLAEEALRDSEVYRRALAYWRGRLPSLPAAPELPLARDPSTLRQPRFVRRSARLEPGAWLRLKRRAAQAGLTPSGALAAAFAEVLAAWSKSARFTINLTLFNRLPLHPQVHDIVGDFTATILLEVDSAAGATFEARAQRLQAQLWEDLEHSQVSGVRVLRELARARGAGTIPMPVVFTSTLINARERSGPEDSSGAWQVLHSISQTPQVWLDHQVSEQAGALVFNWDAVDELFPPGMLDELFAAYCRLLDRLADDDASWQAPLDRRVPLAEPAALGAALLALPELEAPPRAGAPEHAQTIARIVADVLQIASLDPAANLLELGMSSIEIIRIANRLESELDFRPMFEQFYRSPSVLGLARAYEEQLEWHKLATAAELSAEEPPASFEPLRDPEEREAFKRQRHGLRRVDPGQARVQLAADEPPESVERRYVERRSYRQFLPQPLGLDALAALLGCLRQATIDGQPKYLYPSAGGTYAVQTYLHARPGRVAGLAAGVYYYHPAEHRLVQLAAGVDLDRGIHDPFVNGPIFDMAALSIFLIAQLGAIEPLYGHHSQHYAAIEAGAMLQLLMEAAPASRVGLCPIGSLDFERVRHLFGLDQGHALVHSLLGGPIDPRARLAWAPHQEAYYEPSAGLGDREEIEL